MWDGILVPDLSPSRFYCLKWRLSIPSSVRRSPYVVFYQWWISSFCSISNYFYFSHQPPFISLQPLMSSSIVFAFFFQVLPLLNHLWSYFFHSSHISMPYYFWYIINYVWCLISNKFKIDAYISWRFQWFNNSRKAFLGRAIIILK